MRIAGAVALVTGASSGIGRATAIELARRGATVAVVARREGKLEATAQACREHTAGSFALTGDIGVAQDCRAVVAEVEERLGQLDIVVNNAGISMRKHALDTTPDDIEHVLRVNYLGAVHVTMAALPGMVERDRGSIVNVTSVAGYIPNPKESAYGASKAALSLWSHGLAVDLDGTGIHVGVVSPGPIDTEIWDMDETPAAYDGTKHPPETVADEIVRTIEAGRVHVTAPRRYGAVGALYPLPVIGRIMRRGLVRFDPG